MRFFFLIFCVYLVTHTIRAQIVGLPVLFNQYMRSYPQINPASSGSNAKLEVSMGNQRHGGSWNNINTFYLNASYRLGKDLSARNRTADPEQTEDGEEESVPLNEAEPAQYHVAGFNFVGDREGGFLSQTGVYGIYAWHTRLQEHLSLSGGISLGIKNYAVHDNYVNGGGSAFAPDGSVGIWIYDYNYHLGFSVNQVFNSTLTPLNETTRLVPYYNITAGRLWELNPFFAIKPSFLVRMASQRPADININMAGIFQHILSATLGYRYKKGMTTMLGIERIRVGESNFKMMLSYHIPFIKYNQYNIYTYEITLNYFLGIKNKDRIVFQ